MFNYIVSMIVYFTTLIVGYIYCPEQSMTILSLICIINFLIYLDSKKIK